MKKLTLAVAALALVSLPAFAATHTGHDNSPPMNTGHTMTDAHPMKHHKTAHTSHDKMGELSLGIGGAYSFAKDDYGTRMSDMGLAGGMQLMWHMNKHLAIGFDYTMMAPQAHSDLRGGAYDYNKLRAHHIDLAGKLTVLNWDKMSIYSPMGVGMSKIALKASGTRGGVPVAGSNDKWGFNFYIGAGMQYDLTDDLFLGVEYRYYMPFIKGDDLSSYGKDRYMDFHNIGLRMGMRF